MHYQHCLVIHHLGKITCNRNGSLSQKICSKDSRFASLALQTKLYDNNYREQKQSSVGCSAGSMPEFRILWKLRAGKMTLKGPFLFPNQLLSSNAEKGYWMQYEYIEYIVSSFRF